MLTPKNFDRYKDYLTNKIDLNNENNIFDEIFIILEINILFSSTLASTIK